MSTPDFFTVSTVKYDVREALAEGIGLEFGTNAGKVGPARGKSQPSPEAEQICKAVRDSDLEKLKSLLKANQSHVSDTETYGDAALHLAVRLRRKDIMQLLLANKADIEARNFTAIPGASFWSRDNLFAFSGSRREPDPGDRWPDTVGLESRLEFLVGHSYHARRPGPGVQCSWRWSENSREFVYLLGSDAFNQDIIHGWFGSWLDRRMATAN